MSTIERLREGSGPLPRRVEPRTPVSPQLALRVAVLGAIALVMFGAIFFRLWYLQVLTGEQYVQQANANRLRPLPIPAPRGEIFDREGQSIVTSRTTNAVQIVPSALPPRGAPRLRLYARLGRLLGMSPRHIEALVIKGRSALPYAPVTIKTAAGPQALTVLAERKNDYPGVTQQQVSIRDYPYGEMAAHAIGHVGQISKEELAGPLGRHAFRGVTQGTVVGQEGVEFYYDRYLRGKPGVQRVEVNSEGQAVPSREPVTEPKAGYGLKLTLDMGLQREGEKALLQGIGLANANGNPASAGAFVALDPRNGQVLAMGSYPSFNPNKFARPLTEAEYEALEGMSHHVPFEPSPLENRAVSGGYPTGSTFKPITAMGTLESGVLDPNAALGAGSCIHVSTEQFCNAGHAEYGALDLVNALRVSSDTYFFEVGELANSHGEVIQEEARKLGVGEKTGIDLPEELTGTVPDRAWRAHVTAEELECEHRRHVPSCGISDGRPWSVGDNMHLAVGQGDLLTSPLQMAVAYSTLANAFMNGGSGTVVTPHLGLEIDDSQGGLVRTLGAPPRRHVRLSYADLSLVMEGIHDATSQPGGTSADVWAGWDQAQHPVYGKTGTAERANQADQSWYMCYIADPTRPIVIAVTIEQGGFGDQAAAPAARLMASEWFGKPVTLVHGTNRSL
jgi:penicillin-binding protein 2